MAIPEIVDEINLLKEQYNSLKPLKKEDEDRLWRKLRLEWNYNSNHIEGNTLTYGETELLLIFGKTGDSTKDLRDYEEMKAHDVTVQMVKEMADDKERDLTEADIRQLNKVLLVEPFYKDAITASGEPTQKKIIPGEYKTTSNSVKTKTGEIFQFATVEETPAMMTELIDWYRKAVKDNEHPLYIASLIHYRFVRIHPFDDGNGRTARLLANYVLMKYGYPPTVIKSDDKSNYIGALNQADTGNTQAFVEYFGKTVIAALEMAIKAGKGESIEEQGDWVKELEMLSRSSKGALELKRKDFDLMITFYKSNVAPLIVDLKNKLTPFNELFAEFRVEIKINNMEPSDGEKKSIEELNALFDLGKSYQIRITSSKATSRLLSLQRIENIDVKFIWEGYKPFLPPKKTLGLITELNINLSGFYVQISSKYPMIDTLDELARPKKKYPFPLGESSKRETIKKAYTQEISEEERNQFINNIGRELTQILMEKVKKE